MKPRLFVFFLLTGIALAGCSSISGTLARDPAGYLAIIGVNTELVAIVDGGAPIPMHPQSKAVRLQVSPGRHRVRILQGTALRVDRDVLVSDQQTLEVPVP
jgi:hypothetical protein